MNKSFIERIFPHSPSSVLPQYEYDSSPSRSSTGSGNRISLRDRSSSPVATPKVTRTAMQTTPLSASLVHHDDPFMLVERAAKALEKTLQDLINAQSDALESALPQDQQDDISSVGSPTPTPSMTGMSRSVNGPKTVPIRQPKPKKVSLRSARKGLGKTMDDFARLKKEEVRVIQAESQIRRSALGKAAFYKNKTNGLQTEMEAAQDDGSEASFAAIRAEAGEVEREIHALENRLFELRTRHRHLLDRAEEHENTIQSKLSSFKHSIAAVERDTRQFLRQPPVACSLSNYDDSKSTRGGMYALKAERRTLDMAQEQWNAEQDLLEQRKSSAEREEQALRDGADLWRNAISRIENFEKSLRQKVHLPEPAINPGDIVSEMDTLVQSLSTDYARAEANDWKLLMVALGAELVALSRAREMLVGPSEAAGKLNGDTDINATGSRDIMDDEATDPPDDLLNRGPPGKLSTASSNESLKATLAHFSDQSSKGGKMPPQTQNLNLIADGNDSEDDGPSPDFLVSH